MSYFNPGRIHVAERRFDYDQALLALHGLQKAVEEARVKETSNDRLNAEHVRTDR